MSESAPQFLEREITQNKKNGLSMLLPIKSESFIPFDDNSPLPEWDKIFGNNNPLAVEIGCGIGDFILQFATMHPEINFVAIDFYNKGCLKTSNRIDKHQLKNVKVFRVEARSFIERCIPLVSLAAVIINCPDPWPKKRHRKRRLVQPDFLNFIRKFMRDGADFYFSTDFEDYGEDVSAFMPKIERFQNMLSPEKHKHNLENYPLSKYMKKFMAEGKRIYYIHYKAV